MKHDTQKTNLPSCASETGHTDNPSSDSETVPDTSAETGSSKETRNVKSHHRPRQKPSRMSVRSMRYRDKILGILSDGARHPGKEIAAKLNLRTPANVSTILSSLQHELFMERGRIKIKCCRRGREKFWWLVDRS